MLQVLKIFKVFGAQSYLMVVYQFDQGNYVCEEYNNFQNLRSIFMSNYKFSQYGIWDSWMLVYCRFNSYFMFYKGKTPLFFNL